MQRGSLLFATRNKGKLAEASAVATRFGISVRGIDDLSPSVRCAPPEVLETGSTYEENAVLKARSYAAWAGGPAISDDSGLEIQEMGGLPGVYTAHYGLARLLAELIPGVRYAACFRCCMALAEPAGRTITVAVSLPGAFVRPIDGAAILDPALPYSSFFYPQNESESLSMLMRREGGYSSHRTKALIKLLEVVG
jgi:XTP/dITP diphosphohydrolase